MQITENTSHALVFFLFTSVFYFPLCQPMRDEILPDPERLPDLMKIIGQRIGILPQHVAAIAEHEGRDPHVRGAVDEHSRATHLLHRFAELREVLFRRTPEVDGDMDGPRK